LGQGAGFDGTPLLLTLKLAALSTSILVIVALPLAYWLARSTSRLKPVWEAVTALTLVLPPTVLGFYLLMVFGRASALGVWMQDVAGVQLAFTFKGVVIASVLYSLPFMLQPLQAGVEAVERDLLDAARVMGASRWQLWRRVWLPMLRRALVTGCVLTFAHTVGEFGVIMMIGGNIAGETRVASIALYDEVQALNYGAAHSYALILLALSFALLVTVYTAQKRME
jgi:molybdate transport system permease protein